ncbi:MAG: hypothetical protein M1819_003920 [Sarea resinae]|nr:MAG: hypothetical protein M1819_003920 [Sarea resinae]
MHILVVNDDGPPSNQSSPYVHSFISHLQAAGHTVSVVLPHTQRSWIGKAHIVGATVVPTYFRPGTVHKDDGTTHSRPLPQGAKGEEWVLVDGTPASCVQIGLYHFFKDRSPVDLVVSGPNYGRNSTAVFALSSGTIGGALEAAVCGRRAIALSYAFFSRNHDPEIIAGASRLSVKVIEHLYRNWSAGVDLYNVNVPLVEDVESHKVVFTNMLQNYWSSGSSFQEVEAEDEEENPKEHEKQIREEEINGDETIEHGVSRHQHKHFKWAPKFSDVYQSVEKAPPGNDGWAVKEGYTSVTPLKANFMHASPIEGELKLNEAPNSSQPPLSVLIDYEDPYVQPLILRALESCRCSLHKTIQSTSDLPEPGVPVLQITSYESLDFEHILSHPKTSFANAYVIRKALIRKHYLSTTVFNWITKHPDSILKKHIKPAIDFEVDYAEFLDDALLEAYELRESWQRNEGKDKDEREWWILKPGMSDRGQGIRLFSTEEELTSIFEEWEEEEPDTDDEPESEPEQSAANENDEKTGSGIVTSQLRHFIAQPYIDPPLLLKTPGANEGQPRKFHIRTYVLAIGSLKVYVYPEMLALFARTPYSPPWSTEDPNQDLDSHLTNTCLQSANPDPSSVQPFGSFEDSSSAPAGWKEDVFAQICAVTGEVFLAAARTMPTHFQPLPNAFEVFGVDFLVDDQANAWLLEINAFPDFAQTGDSLKGIVARLWENVVSLALEQFLGWDSFSAKASGEESTTARHKPELKKVLDVDLGRR